MKTQSKVEKDLKRLMSHVEANVGGGSIVQRVRPLVNPLRRLPLTFRSWIVRVWIRWYIIESVY